MSHPLPSLSFTETNASTRSRQTRLLARTRRSVRLKPYHAFLPPTLLWRLDPPLEPRCPCSPQPSPLLLFGVLLELLSDLTPSDADDDDATFEPDPPTNPDATNNAANNAKPSHSQKRKAHFKARRSVKRQRGSLTAALENPALPSTNPTGPPS
ncbi:hypothetical protein GGX14DRAFT_571421 [Mycena pura]|uniref:Uncharacterized protein n=1 Tax=Mycena pura TaxID=153505 RepID=A0AAD6V3D7_9AGAR|nr:hypothetical protein GGX14DRAFT_571421 [Mycena pura]